MNLKRWNLVLTVALLLVISALAVSAFGQGGDGAKATAAIQYKLVPMPSPMTQAQFQSLLTAQGNAGWRLMGPTPSAAARSLIRWCCCSRSRSWGGDASFWVWASISGWEARRAFGW